MRLFVAVDLPSAAAAAAAAVSDLLHARLSRMAPHARLTWVAPERMHLTIRFIGEVDEATAERIAAALAEPLQTAAFPLTFGEAGAFPSRGAPRVLWLGIAQGGQDLQRLEQEVSARLEPAGIPREGQRFSPHLTLARVRDARGLRGAAAWAEVQVAPGGGGVVDAITLFESRLSPKGPTYTALQRTPLRA